MATRRMLPSTFRLEEGSFLKKTRPENKDQTRKEEPTKAPTPDKLDRAGKEESSTNPDREKDKKPYPLTEEEATPNTPKSQQQPI